MLWLGWAYFAKKVHPPWRGGVNSDLLVILCASPMKNAPGRSEMPQDGFRTKQKVLPPPKNVFLGPGLVVDITSLPACKNLVKKIKN